jgi:Lysozyme inhibitor LprI
MGEIMSAKRDFVAEIEEIRDRTGPSDWDNGITKLLFLCTQTKKLEKESEELAYFPVASIAAIETYFRWEIRRLIDFGSAQYINNFRLDESPLRISQDLVVALHGKRVTIGELVAHSVRLNNLDAISKTMGQLLQTDFLDLVKDARDPESRREQGDNAPTVIGSAGDTLTRVKRAFELRHIICHEAHLSTAVRLDEVRELCSSCYEFVRASRYGIAYKENPNAPLTLAEAYKAARERIETLEVKIKTVEKLIISKLDPPMQKAFDAMQQAWRLYVERQAEFDASHHFNGNRGALYEQLVIESLYNKRLDEMKEYAGKIDAGQPAL